MTHAEKKPAPKDWHPADIKAALTKAGWSMNQLGYEHGYTSKSALGAVLRRPWPKAEKLVAAAIGVPPLAIWPSRYHADGTPNRVKGPRPLRPAGIPAQRNQDITRCAVRNPQSSTSVPTGGPSAGPTGAPTR